MGNMWMNGVANVYFYSHQCEERIVHITNVPFCTTDWGLVERVERTGEAGTAWWRTQQFGEIRVRMVEYSAGYIADHWCDE